MNRNSIVSPHAVLTRNAAMIKKTLPDEKCDPAERLSERTQWWPIPALTRR